MLCLVVRSATRAREPPLADADQWSASLRCRKFPLLRGPRVGGAHATDGAGGPSARKMGDNESRLSEP
eukprot:6068173-Prymnesium_polylepis.1